MSCTHDKRKITWMDPFGVVHEALLTANGSWVWVPRLGCIQTLTECPGCGVVLWGVPARNRRELPAEAHQASYRAGVAVDA